MTRTRGLVLVVEDDDDTRAMMSVVLEFQGARVIGARDGVEAFNLARAHRPSMILLDIMMPVMTGEEFRRVQMADPLLRKIPVVVVSAHHDAGSIARRIGAVACLQKPVDFDRLEEVVRQHAG